MSVLWRSFFLLALVLSPFLAGCGAASTSESSARDEAEQAAAEEAEDPDPPDD